MWEIIKGNFTGNLYKTLDQLSGFIETQVCQLTETIVVSACAYSYIFDGINWTT